MGSVPYFWLLVQDMGLTGAGKGLLLQTDSSVSLAGSR
jgi:hypothetical protein